MDTADSICVAHTGADSAAAAAAELRAKAPRGDYALVLVLFAPTYDAHELAAALAGQFGDVCVVGCSTAGALMPYGLDEAGALALAFPSAAFTAIATPLEGLSTLSMREAQGAARAALAWIAAAVPDWSQSETFGLLLVDGLSNREEPLVSALYGGLEGLSLVGGSAGDGLAFARTHILIDGRAVTDAAALVLIHSRRPFHAFRCDHFDATPVKLVVTRADVERRIVYELNAANAAQEYAAAVGIPGAQLSPMSFAAHPVVVRVGGDYFVRSIQKINEDGSLSFFCAIDEGIVLTVARSNDMIQSVETALAGVRAEIGEPEIVIGFECVLRRLEAEMYQIKHKVEDLYRENRIVGFHTYGEQYRAMHLNQTFTGIAIGR
jgi:hypothetical protein